jgi:hypothetical protein
MTPENEAALALAANLYAKKRYDDMDEWKNRENIRRLIAEVEALRAFKTWVHAYLDGKGVPKEFPDGPHTKEGCRIGDRLAWVWAERDRLQARVAEIAEHVRGLHEGFCSLNVPTPPTTT